MQSQWKHTKIPNMATSVCCDVHVCQSQTCPKLQLCLLRRPVPLAWQGQGNGNAPIPRFTMPQPKCTYDTWAGMLCTHTMVMRPTQRTHRFILLRNELVQAAYTCMLCVHPILKHPNTTQHGAKCSATIIRSKQVINAPCNLCDNIYELE